MKKWQTISRQLSGVVLNNYKRLFRLEVGNIRLTNVSVSNSVLKSAEIARISKYGSMYISGLLMDSVNMTYNAFRVSGGIMSMSSAVVSNILIDASQRNVYFALALGVKDTSTFCDSVFKQVTLSASEDHMYRASLLCVNSALDGNQAWLDLTRVAVHNCIFAKGVVSIFVGFNLNLDLQDVEIAHNVHLHSNTASSSGCKFDASGNMYLKATLKKVNVTNNTRFVPHY